MKNVQEDKASAAYSRVDIPEEERKPFHIFLDEFHNYSTISLIDGLSEIRKFKVSLCLAHQFTKQIDTDVLNSVIGNVGTKIIFRCGHQDASIWSNEMKPYFEDVDFMRLPNRVIYLSLMINGKPSKPFSASTILLEQ